MPSPITPSDVRRTTCWAVAAFFLALAIQAKEGTYSPSAILFLTLAIGSTLFGVFGTSFPTWFPNTARGLNFVLGGMTAVFVALWMVPANSPLFIVLVAIVVCSLLALLLMRLARGAALQRVLFPAVLVIYTLFGAVSILGAKVDERTNPKLHHHVRNDVQFFAQEAAGALVHGKNPYSLRMLNVMGSDLPFYPPGATDKNGRLPFGYPYMPLSVAFSLPGYLLGDLRLANLFALVGAAFFLAYARPSTTSRLAATVFLLLPSALLMLVMSWTEPVAIFFLAATVFCFYRAPRWLPLALGFLVASKQYTLFLLPLLPLLIPEKERWKPLVWQSLGIAALLTVPMALWDIDGFYRSVVQMQFKQPFRHDSLSYFVLVLKAGGPQLTPLIGFAALVAAFWWGLKKAPRLASGWCAAAAVAYFGFFALNKQAFANYYFWIFSLLMLAVAVSLPERGRDEALLSEKFTA